MVFTRGLRISILILISTLFTNILSFSQKTQTIKILKTNKQYKLYPILHDNLPDIPSPFTTENGMELVVAFTKNKKYALIPVTVASSPLNLQYGREKIGKGDQLQVDAEDFPTLEKTSLHSEKELEQTKMITGRSISEINEIARPESSSGVGFISHNEDIISVLIGDNRLVKKLDQTHKQMAKPLFQVWNLILNEYELGNIGRTWDNIEFIMYNGIKIFIKAKGTKGFQESIFNDEVKGTFEINIWRELNEKEKSFLNKKYPHLSTQQMTELEEKISKIHFSEMIPYYINRYGFYEGHTYYRSDPLAIAFIFGLKSLEEIEDAFDGILYETMVEHFTVNSIQK